MAGELLHHARWGLDRGSSLVLIAIWLWLATHPPVMVDSTTYWRLDPADPYAGGIANEVGAYLYSPVFAQLIAPLTLLPWQLFYALLTGVNLLILALLLRPAPAVLTLGFPAVTHAIWIGNIHFLMAGAAVLAVRYPAAWAFPLLTKVTPGIAISWHLGRGEWQMFGRAIAWTAGIALISFILAPQLWFEWLDVLTDSAGAQGPITLLPLPLWARVALAGVICVIGGRLGYAWVIPVGMTIAQPIFWTAGLATLVAAVPLARLRPGSAVRPTPPQRPFLTAIFGHRGKGTAREDMPPAIESE